MLRNYDYPGGKLRPAWHVATTNEVRSNDDDDEGGELRLSARVVAMEDAGDGGKVATRLHHAWAHVFGHVSIGCEKKNQSNGYGMYNRANRGGVDRAGLSPVDCPISVKEKNYVSRSQVAWVVT